ncbi:serine carboxypeptidase-domain-containing protein [Chlamydoabsidia padenii]|nr:serine carboxypeptidase-domain-containing protein [Chlamydoabsidia padenii]
MTLWKSYTCSILYAWLLSQSLVLAQKAEDYKVTTLPGVKMDQLPFDQYAGHIEVSSKTNGNLFFWMLDQVQPTEPKKLIIWLNGGPGCSSMDGLFLENGPYRVNPDQSLTVNANGWQDHATIVFLDQPVGTGFSFANTGGFMHNMTQVAEEFTTFLDKFMAIFPHLKEQDLYLTGESFAGTYIPYFADRMLKVNHKETNKYNLKGIAIGNGWISPRHQYEAYVDFSLEHNLLEGDYLDRATKNLNKCREKLSLESKINIGVCEDILEDITESNTHSVNSGKVCMNMYDIRLKNETSPGCGNTWPHELEQVSKYLRTDELKKAVHSVKQVLPWQECAATVSQALRYDTSLPSDLLLPDILKEIKVLLYSGEYDLICNHIGTEYMIGNMTWNGEKGFKDAVQQDWFIDDKQVGYYTEGRNLSYVLIKDGSHMVPYDKPTETLDMIHRFMGVGNNQVNGVKSRVGNQDQPDQGSDDQKDDTAVEPDQESDNQKDDTAMQDEETGDEEGTGFIGGYGKSAGNYGALVVLVVLLLIGACCYRSSIPSVWQRVKNRFTGNPQKFRLGDQDETNELDELVVGDNSTLFAAEEHGGEHPPLAHHNSASRFAIADSDDGFDDFADWDEEETLASVKPKKDGKDH